MSWHFATDGFPATASTFLSASPVDNSILLTEAAYLASSPAGDQRFGWWVDDERGVAGAFLRAPRHTPVLSMMPPAAVAALPVLSAAGVDGRMADTAREAWGLVEGSRIRLHRLGRLRRPSLPPGTPRVATAGDRPLLVSWYEELMAAHPEDPSDLAYVVDDPLRDGGIMLWEVGGEPVAMAGRSRIVAGMTRLGAVHAPGSDRHGRAALVAACAAASQLARDVLIFAPAGDDSVRELGFEPVLDRVMLRRP